MNNEEQFSHNELFVEWWGDDEAWTWSLDCKCNCVFSTLIVFFFFIFLFFLILFCWHKAKRTAEIEKSAEKEFSHFQRPTNWPVNDFLLIAKNPI